MSNRIETYDEFYLYYLREHRKPLTRLLHYIAAFASLSVALYALIFGPLIALLLVPVAGYGPAWIGHFFIEKNRPATFQYPGWSLISDYVMTWHWLTGRLSGWLRRAGVVPSDQR
ncbi:MAG: DUF962 domain-containing protein [Rhodothalassiaceae bacterium]